MTSQEDLKLVPLYSLINEKWTFVVITEQISETASLYLVYVCPIWLWIGIWLPRSLEICFRSNLFQRKMFDYILLRYQRCQVIIGD